MKPTVYIETTIIGHLASRLPKDPIVAGLMLFTRKWWEYRRKDFELYVSEPVVNELSAGDPVAARERLELISTLPSLPMVEPAQLLSQQLISRNGLPVNARVDALHVALAAVHGIDYLLTWNCRHLANAQLLERVRSVCHELGFDAPTICTPLELSGETL
jgi:predicted nucleic acid-binding protein